MPALEAPPWLKELGEWKCVQKGDLMLCYACTDKYPWGGAVFTGEFASLCEVRVGRVGEDEWVGFKVFAKPGGVDKGDFIELVDRDTLVVVADYTAQVSSALKVSNKEEKVGEAWVRDEDIWIRVLRASEKEKGKVVERPIIY